MKVINFKKLSEQVSKLIINVEYANGKNDTKLYDAKIIRKSQISIWDNSGKSLGIKWNRMLILILHFIQSFGISQFED